MPFPGLFLSEVITIHRSKHHTAVYVFLNPRVTLTGATLRKRIFMDPQEVLRLYLFDPTSCFNAALRDARKATGRQLNDNSRSDINHGSWLGAIGYIVLLDQIGGCLKPKNRGSRYENGFKKALDYFVIRYILEVSVPSSFG